MAIFAEWQKNQSSDYPNQGKPGFYERRKCLIYPNDGCQTRYECITRSDYYAHEMCEIPKQ